MTGRPSSPWTAPPLRPPCRPLAPPSPGSLGPTDGGWTGGHYLEETLGLLELKGDQGSKNYIEIFNKCDNYKQLFFLFYILTSLLRKL